MVPEETLKETFDRIWEEIHGSNLYAGQPRNEASAHSVSRAQHALQLAINSGHDRLMIEAWRMLAYSLTATDQFEQSDSMYERAERLSEELQLANLLAQASYNRAYLQYLRGRYSEALHSFSRLRPRFERAGSQRHCALCDLDQAEIYLEINLSQDASILAERAVEEFKLIGMRYEQAKAAGFYGVALMQMERFDEALDAFRSAQEIFEEEGNLYWIGLLN